MSFKKKLQTVLLALLAMPMLATSAALPVAAAPGEACPTPNVFTFPVWYRGVYFRDNNDQCAIDLKGELNKIWVIALNVIEIFLQLCGYFALGYLVWGSIKFIKSQGNPENINNARSTLINAALGLIISLAAVAIVNYVTGLF